MSTDIYVDHLPVDVTAEEIRELFCAFGIVEHISLIKNRNTGCLCGFGFVAMQSGANEAIAALHDRELGGSRLNVQYPAKLRQQPLPQLHNTSEPRTASNRLSMSQAVTHSVAKPKGNHHGEPSSDSSPSAGCAILP